MNAVFDTKPLSSYDDNFQSHYQFPSRYLTVAEKCVGDWVILRRPRADGGDLKYFAVAKVVSIDPDEEHSGLSFARLAGYTPFGSPVPWRVDGRYAEADLRGIPRREVGTYLRGRSVRALSDEDFQAIATAGLGRALQRPEPGGSWSL